MEYIIEKLLGISEILGTIVITFFISFLIFRWLMKYLSKIEKLEFKTNELPCDRHSEILVKHGEALSAIKASIKTTNGLSQSQSPLSLSPLGEKTAQKMNIREIIQNNWTSINAYIQERAESKNAYDLQQLCLETAAISLEAIINETDLDKIKAFAFDEGETLFHYAVMIGIIIRDLYFKEHNIQSTLEVSK